jgi:4-hydroxymandelate oxidase
VTTGPPDRTAVAGGRGLSGLLTVADVHAAALDILQPDVADFLDGGAGDEVTLRANEAAYDAVELVPRVLRDVSYVDTTTTVLGAPVAVPILLGAAGAHKLFHPDGELAYARTAAAMGTGIVVSTGASVSIEDVASVAPDLRWFQVYCYRDRAITQSLLERARDASYLAICLTVDTPRHGRRLRNLRNGFSVPNRIPRANFEGIHRRSSGAGGDLTSFVRDNYDASLTWEDLEWLASISRLPLVLKGILNPDDARLALAAGVAGVIVSNHGGRQLDGATSTVDALPAIKEAVGDRLEVYLDGGIRSGSDVVKALALGADAVFVVRPFLWGLAVGGEAGVRHVLQLLGDELELAMSLMGARSRSDLLAGSVARTGVARPLR